MKKIPTFFPKNEKNLRLIKKDKPLFNVDKDTNFYIKLDGQSCAIINGKLYTRYDAKLIKRKRNKLIKKTPEKVKRLLPEGAIECQSPDLKSGHWPHWVPVLPEQNKTHKYIYEGYKNSKEIFGELKDGTYEIIGPKFQENKHGLKEHILYPHTHETLKLEDIKEKILAFLNKKNEEDLYDFFYEYLKNFPYEGIVIYKNGEPAAKIRRRDYNLDIKNYNIPLKNMKEKINLSL